VSWTSCLEQVGVMDNKLASLFVQLCTIQVVVKGNISQVLAHGHGKTFLLRHRKIEHAGGFSSINVHTICDKDSYFLLGYP
jgi:hypothetical protein